MNKKYIYSTSRVRTLQNELLSGQQLERMVTAKDTREAFAVLSDTFLAPFVAGVELSGLPRALRKSVSAGKRLLAEIAPEPEIMNILWYRYDFYNLRVTAKAARVGLSDEEIDELCYYAGSLPPREIISAWRKEKFTSLYGELARAAEEIKDEREPHRINLSADKHYFAAITAVAKKSGNSFLRDYVSLLVDFYNLRLCLRWPLLAEQIRIAPEKLRIEGGKITFSPNAGSAECEKAFSDLNEELFRAPLKAALREKDFSLLEKAIDDYLRDFLVARAEADIFSPAPLFRYFVALRADAALVKTIMAAKESEMSAERLRGLLRKLY